MNGTDALAGAPELLNGLKDLLYRNRFEALVLFDIDRFSDLNESDGRESGDCILEAVASWLGKHGWIGYRIGGDEFGILFDAGQSVEDHVLRDLPAFVEDQTGLSVTFSGGGVRKPGREFGMDPQMAETIFSAAQQLVARAKHTGRDRVLWLSEASDDETDLTDILLRFYRELARVNAALAKQMALESRTDFLTGVYNRRGFEEVFERMVRRSQRNGRPLALLYMDSDSLKDINDSKGHDAGDRFIVDLSRVLNEMLRGSDLLSRWAGDEFAAVVEHTDRDRALAIALRLNEAIAKRTEGTMSIGIYYGVPESADEALKKADEALYRVKNRGKNDIELAE